VSGCLAGAITPENTLTKTFIISAEANSSRRDDAIVTVLNEENTANELCQLLAKEGTGATKLAILIAQIELSGLEQDGSAITALVMSL
jgi:hypothetical protein